jgi:hypothetical protein
MEHAAAVLREHERQYNNYRPAPITPSAPAGRPHSPALRERPFERCDEIGSAASYTSMCGSHDVTQLSAPTGCLVFRSFC